MVGLCLCIEGVVVWIEFGCCVRIMLFLKVRSWCNWKVFWNLGGCSTLIQNKLLIFDRSKVVLRKNLTVSMYLRPVVLLVLGFYHVSWFLILHNNMFLVGEWSRVCHKVIVIDFWYLECCFFNLIVVFLYVLTRDFWNMELFLSLIFIIY